MEKTEARFVSFGVRPGFFWLGWAVVMVISVAGMALSIWPGGRPSSACAGATLIFLVIGALYRARQRKTTHMLAAAAIIAAASFAHGQTIPLSDGAVRKAFGDRTGVFVMVDCSSGAVSDSDQKASSERILPPCSTFKIWNTLIGLETGVVSSPDEPFYRWDGEVRPIPEWNKDSTLKEAFRASCLPAFQNLARKIGKDRMQAWIKKIGYGDRDISAGLDVFWLPAKGRKTILITPREQADLMCRLGTGKLPVSEKSLAVLREIMAVKKTDRGILYGKTGSGMGEDGKYTLGWFVGFVESKGSVYGFACESKGDNVMGKDARTITEAILVAHGVL